MHARRTIRLAAALCLVTLLLSATAARGEVKLSPLFSDHLVLQQGMAVPVWGTAEVPVRQT